MDELIEYIAHTPENTNFNIVREILKGSNVSSESNFKAFQRILLDEINNNEGTLVLLDSEGTFHYLDFINPTPLVEGTTYINDTVSYITVNCYDDYTDYTEENPLELEPVQLITVLPPADPEQNIEEILENYHGDNLHIFASNKILENIPYSEVNNEIFLTQQELENDCTDLGSFQTK